MIYKAFYRHFLKKLNRYCILWPKAVFRKVDLKRYHQHLAVMAVGYVVPATLYAIENNADGSWGMPLFLFYMAVLLFVFGSIELMLIVDKRYKGEVAKFKAVSRSISCYGVAFTFVLMCELYAFSVHY